MSIATWKPDLLSRIFQRDILEEVAAIDTQGGSF